MPILAVFAKNTMLDALNITSVSLHTAYDAAGGHEVGGGSPAYARLAAAFAAAALGKKSLIGGPYLFDIPATTIAWIGMRDGGGNFMGMSPNGGGLIAPFAVNDIFGDVLVCAAHAYVVNDTVVVWKGSATALPAGLAEGTVYYVTNVPSIDTLQLSTSLGGGAVDLTATGNGYVQRIILATNAVQALFSLTVLTLDANVAA